MSNVSVIGNGTMGQAIAGVAAAGGNRFQVLGHGDGATAVTGDIVVLAVPYGAVAQIVAARGTELAGKVVVDITNPVDFQTFDSLVVPADSSAAAQIAQALPQAKVVKAFNTTFGATVAAGQIGPLTTTVLLAGDDADAKAAGAAVRRAGRAGRDRRRRPAPGSRARGARLPADQPGRGREGPMGRRLRGGRRLTGPRARLSSDPQAYRTSRHRRPPGHQRARAGVPRTSRSAGCRPEIAIDRYAGAECPEHDPRLDTGPGAPTVST